MHHDGSLVGTAMSFAVSTSVPGGAVLPAAAVSCVGVRADRTRRGVLTALIRAQLDDTTARGEVLSTLWASEARIYGRFGYGVATRGRSVRVARARGLRPQAPAGGSVRLLDRAELPTVLPVLYDALALCRPGGITRPEGWWRLATETSGRDHVLAAVHTGRDGDDGFVVAVPARGDEFVRPLQVADFHAADPASTAALWGFLLGVDLTANVEASMRPLDEPLDLLLADPRDRTVTGEQDETWLRLVDVPTALAARAFPADPDRGATPVLLAVHDPLLPGNSGVYRLGDGAAERVAPLGGCAAQLECGVAALASAYLGDRAPSALAATGWWTVHDPAALSHADALFATTVAPWCGTHF